MIGHFVGMSCGGEFCGPCRSVGDTTAATHKVGEEVARDEPMPFGMRRHNFTQYVCCSHFIALFGPAVFCLESFADESRTERSRPAGAGDPNPKAARAGSPQGGQ